MTNERWHNLMKDDSLRLSQEELDQGWHFCYEFDGLLVGPGMDEQRFCSEFCPKRLDNLENNLNG